MLLLDVVTFLSVFDAITIIIIIFNINDPIIVIIKVIHMISVVFIDNIQMLLDDKLPQPVPVRVPVDVAVAGHHHHHHHGHQQPGQPPRSRHPAG